MKIFLRLKHWQLFLLLVGPAILFDIFLFGSIIFPLDRSFIVIVFPFVMIFSMGILFGWLYAMGTNLHKQLPGNVTMNIVSFTILFLVAFIFMTSIFVLIFISLNRALADKEPLNLSMSTALIFFLYLFFMYCMFYCLYFTAKALKAVELQRPVTFGDYAGEFFLIWFFIIGVWIIQPRLNRLFSKKQSAETYI